MKFKTLLILSILVFVLGKPEGKNLDSQDIYFPLNDEADDPKKHLSNRMVTPEIKSKHCVGHLCETVDDYPEESIVKLIKETKEFDSYFIKDVQFDIVNRDIVSDTETFCHSTAHYVFPKSAKDINNKEKLIVNVDGYKQGVNFETCAKGSACKLSNFFPDNYIFKCEQRYSSRRLVALDDDKKPMLESFDVPSCCVCTFKMKPS